MRPFLSLFLALSIGVQSTHAIAKCTVNLAKKAERKDIERLWQKNWDYHLDLKGGEAYYLPKDQAKDYIKRSLNQWAAKPEAGSPQAQTFIAVASVPGEERPVGFVIFHPPQKDEENDSNFSGCGEISEVFVGKKYRNHPSHRVGSSLMAFAEKSLSGQGTRCVKLQVSASNTSAVRFYERKGYGLPQLLLHKKLESAE